MGRDARRVEPPFLLCRLLQARIRPSTALPVAEPLDALDPWHLARLGIAAMEHKIRTPLVTAEGTQLEAPRFRAACGNDQLEESKDFCS